MTEEEKKKASVGVRRNLHGEVLGDYPMRQDNTRMRNIGPTETPDLNEEQKENLRVVSDAEGKGWEKTKEGVSATKKDRKGEDKLVVDNLRTHGSTGYAPPDDYTIATANEYDEYTDDNGNVKKVKTGEIPVATGWNNKIGATGVVSSDMNKLHTGKADQVAPKKGLAKWAYGKGKVNTDPNDPELVKHKPTNNK